MNFTFSAAANSGADSARASTSTPSGRGSTASGVFVDAVTGRHASTSAAELLATRRLIWDKHYGWTYDAWIDDPARYALAGANGRFSLPALARGLSATLSQAAGAAAVFLGQQKQLQIPGWVTQQAGLGGGQRSPVERPPSSPLVPGEVER